MGSVVFTLLFVSQTHFRHISPKMTPILQSESFLAYFVLKIVGAEGGTRTHTPLLVTDFKKSKLFLHAYL